LDKVNDIVSRIKGAAEEVGLNVLVPRDLHRRLKAFAALHDMSLKEFVRQAVEEKLRRDDEGAAGAASSSESKAHAPT